VAIRTPCPEDHLRLICIHLLKHGGARPLWLCDVGAAIESAAPDFDWDRLMRDNRSRAFWIMYAVGLAHRLLGARIDNTPFYATAKTAPVWMERSLLGDWSTPRRILHIHDARLEDSFGSCTQIFNALRLRWPNPIEVTVIYGGPLNRITALAGQFRFSIAAAFSFMVKMLRKTLKDRL
jgi:hypothetical protein